MQNLHTHTTLSDGQNTPEEMVEAAIKLGFESIGISDHAKMEFDRGFEIDVPSYILKINSLKEKYKDKIRIYLGAELDYYSKGIMRPSDYEYTIGSVHYVKLPSGNVVSYDESPTDSLNHIKNDFGGDALAYVKAYFETMADLPNRFDFDIVGHFDSPTKYLDKYEGFFDTKTKEYRRIALEALHAVREKREFFELNSGGIGRGWKTMPYPELFILEELKKTGAKMLITSDTHSADTINCNFKESRLLLKSVGFTEIYNLTENGFAGEKI